MSVPKLDARGGIYRLVWADEQISVRVDRIAEDSKFTVTGEILIRTNAPGYPPHLHRARLNLTSTPARRTLIKEMAERMPDIDWYAIVEQTCVKVLDTHREGPPLIQIAEYNVPERLPFRLQPFLEEKQATVLFGHGDTGKSYLAMYLAVLVCTGIKKNGLLAEPGNALYLDYEADEDTFWRRIDRITAGLNISIPDNLFYRRNIQPLVADIERVQNIVVDKGINLVVIDSAALAVPEPEVVAPTSAYFMALRTLEVTSLTIAHLTKTGRQDLPFGSIFWRNIPRANFRTTATRDPGASFFTMGVQHTKANDGKYLSSIGFHMLFEDDPPSLSIERTYLSDNPEMAKDLSLKQSLEETLRKGSKTVEQLIEQLEQPRQQILNKLNQHKKVFVRFDHGGVPYWGLAVLVNLD